MISALVPKVRFCVDQDLLLKVLGKCQDWLLVAQYNEFRWIMLECFGVLVSLENKLARVDALLKFTWDCDFDFFAWQVIWEGVAFRYFGLGLFFAYVSNPLDFFLGFFASGFQGSL